MTYLEWAQRFAELAFPWADPLTPTASSTCCSASKPV